MARTTVALWALALALPATALASGSSCAVADGDKQDCGYMGEDDCLALGCCWEEHTGDDGAVPWCFQAGTAAAGYGLAAGYNLTASGLVGSLVALDPGTDSLGADISTLALSIMFDSADQARVLITPADDDARWQIPESIVPASLATDDAAPRAAAVGSNYELTFTESPFTFTLTRTSDGAVLFNSTQSLVFKDQYLELTTSLDPSASLFGLGESTRSAGLPVAPGTTSTLWARDMPALVFDSNLYGSHPMFLALAASGTAGGAFLRNSNGMDIEYAAAGDALTYKVLGGVVDLFVFAGPTPADVTAQYTALVGRPAMMPYWALGYHQCRYGYTELADVETVKDKFAEAAIPLDVVWMDIDYMAYWKDWTYDPVNFPVDDVASFVDTVHADGQKFVVIVDPGILAVDPSWNVTYAPYEDGLAQNVFVKDGYTGQPYMTQVWPGPTLMPDWFHPNASAYWEQSIAAFYQLAQFDGLWTDMNEVSNFCNDGGQGQVCANTDPNNCPTLELSTQTTCCLSCWVEDASDSLDYPPYAINNDNAHQALGHKTLPMSALHYNENEAGDDKFTLTEYNVHNLFGLMEARLTAEALTAVRGGAQRPFVLSRSTFPSHGAHAAHWTGDNAATWDDLKAASVTVMNMNLFGIPMIGSDMCGFNGATTEELCARWMALGAFHPFSRNHNAIGEPDQEPYLWDSVTAVSQAALGLRYRLLPFLYTLFDAAHAAGSLVAQPLWVAFPTDATTHAVDEQFMWGDAILVSPALYEGQETVDAYFPCGDADGCVWFSLSENPTAFAQVVVEAGSTGVTATLDTPLESFNVHVKSGAVVPMHGATDADGAAPLTLTAARALPYELLVAFNGNDESATANGQVMLDDGEQVELSDVTRLTYSASLDEAVQGQVTVSVDEDGWAGAADLALGAVTVLGQAQAPSAVDLLVSGAAKNTSVAFAFDASTASLRIDLTGAGVAMDTAFTLSWQ